MPSGGHNRKLKTEDIPYIIECISKGYPFYYIAETLRVSTPAIINFLWGRRVSIPPVRKSKVRAKKFLKTYFRDGSYITALSYRTSEDMVEAGLKNCLRTLRPANFIVTVKNEEDLLELLYLADLLGYKSRKNILMEYDYLKKITLTFMKDNQIIVGSNKFKRNQITQPSVATAIKEMKASVSCVEVELCKLKTEF